MLCYLRERGKESERERNIDPLPPGVGVVLLLIF